MLLDKILHGKKFRYKKKNNSLLLMGKNIANKVYSNTPILAHPFLQETNLVSQQKQYQIISS